MAGHSCPSWAQTCQDWARPSFLCRPRDLGTRDLIVPSKRGGQSMRHTPRYDPAPWGCGPAGLRAPLFNKRRPFFQPSKLPKGFSEEREQIQSNHNCCTSFRS